MKTLRELHKQAREEKWAMPHFNFSTIDQLHSLIETAHSMRSPLVVGLSEGERKAVGLRQAVALIRSFREQGKCVFLNADHSHSKESAFEAIDAGFDSIHIDLSKEEYEKNKQDTQEVVEYARARNSDIEVEGELGYLVTDSSKVYTDTIEIPEDSYTQPEQAKEYVEYTQVDRFSPVFGNLHGIAANTPQIRFDIIESIRKVVPEHITLVVHGGSGITDVDFQHIVRSGFSNAHISTEIRLAYAQGLRKALNEDPDEIAPYRFVKQAQKALQDVARKKILLFGSDNTIAQE